MMYNDWRRSANFQQRNDEDEQLLKIRIYSWTVIRLEISSSYLD